jgi:hypothetical protein
MLFQAENDKKIIALPPALLISIVAAVIVWLLSFMSGFQVIEGYIYDRFLVSQSKTSASFHADVLLLEMDKAVNKEAGFWSQFLADIEAKKPALVIFSFLPKEASTFYSAAKQYANVIFAPQYRVDEAQVLKKNIDDLGLSSEINALSFLPASNYGVYRMQAGSLQWHEKIYLSASYAALNAVKGDKPMRAKDFYIDFSLGYGLLPFLDEEQINNGGLIRELVEGRVVYLGLKDEMNTPLVTAFMLKGKSLSLLEYHGYALQTLLSGHAIHWAGKWILLLVLILFNILSLIFWQGKSKKWSAAFLLLSILSYALIAWLCLRYFYFWLPLFSISMSQILLFILYTRHRNMMDDKAIWSLLLSSSGKFFDKNIPGKIYASEEHWSKIIVMVSQTLNLNRAIFLERYENSFWVREVKALNCSLSDISERRRDYRRTPYKTAGQTNRPIQVNNYLSDLGESDHQYIIALVYFNETLGYWAFSLKNPLSEEKEKHIIQLSKYVAEILFYRKVWREENEKKKTFSQHYLHLEREHDIITKLQDILSLMERRLTTLEDFIDKQNTANIFFDLFGRVWIANQRALNLLKQADIYVYDITALDLIQKLTGISTDEAREYLQNLIVNGDEASFEVNIKNKQAKNYVMRIAALNTGMEEYDLRESNMLGIERQGFLCEIVSKSATEKTTKAK